MPQHQDPDGPLVYPVQPPDGETMALVTSKLAGHFTSACWLPETDGRWPELDEVREEHLRVRAQVKGDADALTALIAKWRREDRQHALALEKAIRLRHDPPDDTRTGLDQRAAERDDLERSMWAGVRVLAEVVDRARALLVEHEAEWLVDVGRSRVEMEEAVREAERRLHEAKAKAWQGVRMGRWLKNEVEGGPFSGQPAPVGEDPMPPDFDPAQHSDAFERRYYEVERRRPVERHDDPLGVDVLDEGEAVDLIEPLDDAVRFGATR
jgi:hypothetical protein